MIFNKFFNKNLMNTCYCGNEVQNSVQSTLCISQQTQSYEIYTSCPLGLFGLYCENVCHCPNEVQCDLMTGFCPNQCASNWMGPSCNTSMPVYLGCVYLPDNEKYYINPIKIIDQEQLTNELCSHVCIEHQFLYSATQKTNCYCGNEMNRIATLYDVSYCQTKCAGNLTQNCGDTKYKSLSNVCPPNYFGYKCQYECHCMYQNDICSYPDGNCKFGCANGWKGYGCHISDCTVNNRLCNENEICQHYKNYSICECGDGFQKLNQSQNCSDINECILGIDNCSKDTEDCINLKGSYNCTCKLGFHYNLTNKCIDIDECLLEDSVCNLTTHICHNTIGSYRCNLIELIDSSALSSGSKAGMISALSILFILMIILFIAFLLIFRKKRNANRTAIFEGENKEILTKRYSNNKSPAILNNSQSNNLKSLEYIEFSRRNLYLNDIPDYYRDNKNLIENEFINAPEEVTASGEYGRQKCFKEKNRFKNVVPYDKNRVKLSIMNNDNQSDYINASYINFPYYENIIATQGPNQFTINDFWRMVDEENVSHIVMLCNVMENDKIKCNQYWPSENSIVYGSLLVEFLEEIIWPEYKCRRLRIQSEKKASREILQWHYVVWPDHGVPCCSCSILHFIKRFRYSYNESLFKAIIHCSAGIGRTGCFLAIDRLLMDVNRGSTIDVARCLSELRTQRPQLVQTQIQYNFIYECLTAEAELGTTFFPLSEFKKHYNQTNSVVTDAQIAKQYNIIIKDFEEKKSVKKDKSRVSSLFSQHCLYSVMSKFSFTIFVGNKFQDLWNEIPSSCKMAILLSDEKNNFKLKLQEEYLINYKIIHAEKKNYGEYLKLLKLENFNDIYENQESSIYANSMEVEGTVMELHHINLSDAGIINFQNFISIFEILLKVKEQTLLLCTDSNLSTSFVCAFFILEIMVSKKEVCIFQVVQEVRKNFPHFQMSQIMYADLCKLAIKYLHSETCLPWI